MSHNQPPLALNFFFFQTTILLTVSFNSERLTLPLWRSISSLNLMLPKEERRAMLLRLYNDESPLIDHSQQRRAPDASAAAKPEGETIADSDGGVALNADVDEEIVDADAAAIATEDDVRAQAQVVADEDAKDDAAPERIGEGDEFNTTV